MLILNIHFKNNQTITNQNKFKQKKQTNKNQNNINTKSSTKTEDIGRLVTFPKLIVLGQKDLRENEDFRWHSLLLIKR